jgi:glycosyltransferase involved in cell wall biosynthesis
MDIYNAILKVLDDEELKQKLISGGEVQVKKYSWKRMAEKTLEIYKNFLKR